MPLASAIILKTRPWLADILEHMGYVFLTLTGGALALDRFFGFSSSWVRYMDASNRLARILTNLQLDWEALSASFGETPPDDRQLASSLDLFRKNLNAVATVVENETTAWAKLFTKELAETDHLAGDSHRIPVRG